MATDENSDSWEEMESEQKIEWLVKNQYHDKVWQRTREHGRGYISFSEYQSKIGSKSAFYARQKILLQSSKKRISEIKQNHLINTKQLVQILNDNQCKIIKSLSIPNEIIISIAVFVGNGLIPIAYSLDFLPFFRAIREHKLYRDTLEKWWNEITQNPTHRGLFYPKSIRNAAKEFQQFFTNKLAENGINKETRECIKYHRYTVPTFAVDLSA